MRRSKLEICIEILSALSSKGQLKITHIMYKANLNRNLLRAQLDYLIGNGLVTQRTIAKEHVVYAITKKGLNVLRTFNQLDRLLPMIEKPNEIPAIPY